MSDSSFNVDYAADLARIELSEDEKATIGAQLGKILGYIEKLNEVDDADVEPTSHPSPLVNVTRPDQSRPGISQEAALKNAPSAANGLFMVPKIVE